MNELLKQNINKHRDLTIFIYLFIYIIQYKQKNKQKNKQTIVNSSITYIQ